MGCALSRAISQLPLHLRLHTSQSTKGRVHVRRRR
jgi:hypothetical protein